MITAASGVNGVGLDENHYHDGPPDHYHDDDQHPDHHNEYDHDHNRHDDDDHHHHHHHHHHGSRSRFPRDHEDAVKHLPGLDRPMPSNWYSGYVRYELEGQMVHTHYILIEAEYDDDDDNEEEGRDKKEADEVPLIYWSNGGPGASSMFGLLTELGPFVFNNDSLETKEYKRTGIPTPLYNNYAWTKLGHLLLFDGPAPVGFSYCTNITSTADDVDPDSHSCGEISWTDELASLNFYTALNTLYDTKFPSLKTADLYLTGESYAGIYIPTLARRIVRGNDEILEKQEEEAVTNTTDFVIPLRGFAVGDGCLGTETDICGNMDTDSFIDYWYVVFLAGHHQIPITTFREVMKACNGNPGHEPSDILLGNEDQEWLSDDPVCKDSIEKMTKEMGGVWDYSLYDDCIYDNGLMRFYKTRQEQLQQQTIQQTLQNSLLRGGSSVNDGRTLSSYSVDSDGKSRERHYARRRRNKHWGRAADNNNNKMGGALNDYTCGGGPVMEFYLHLDEVKDALNVKTNFFIDDNAENFDYTPTEPDISTFYRELQIRNGNATDTDVIKMLVYNGDTDPAITSFASANWTSKMGFPVEADWGPWTIDGCRRMGGYVTRYENHFEFLTIRGSGHMVPTYKPEASFVFLKAWMLTFGGYPSYNATCLTPPLSLPL